MIALEIQKALHFNKFFISICFKSLFAGHKATERPIQIIVTCNCEASKASSSRFEIQQLGGGDLSVSDSKRR